MLVASSSEVYGNHPRGRSLCRRTPSGSTARRPPSGGPTPTRRRSTSSSPWRCTRSAGLRCVIARLFNTVGPRQNSQYGNVIPRFVQRAARRRAARGPRGRHADALLLPRLGRGAGAGGPDGGAGGERRDLQRRLDRAVTIRELAERMIDAADQLVRARVRTLRGGLRGRYRRGDVPAQPAIDKIAATIGWRPSISLDEILGELIPAARREEPAPTTNA